VYPLRWSRKTFPFHARWHSRWTLETKDESSIWSNEAGERRGRLWRGHCELRNSHRWTLSALWGRRLKNSSILLPSAASKRIKRNEKARESRKERRESLTASGLKITSHISLQSPEGSVLRCFFMRRYYPITFRTGGLFSRMLGRSSFATRGAKWASSCLYVRVNSKCPLSLFECVNRRASIVGVNCRSRFKRAACPSS